ncbi:MAG: hypothetical protein HY321_09930 [Armatimonadetes bacterium]|nr:hypothetical protein [Armatimonadota bacterium]
MRPTALSPVCQGIVVTGLFAGSAVSAAPTPSPSSAGPVVLYVGASHTAPIPPVVEQLAAAMAPAETVTTRLYYRGGRGISSLWQESPLPANNGHVLSWIRYPDPPGPGPLRGWDGRRADRAMINPISGEQYDEDRLYFWVRLYRHAFARHGIKSKPLVYISHQGMRPSEHNFMYSFKSEAAAREELRVLNNGCLRIATELNVEVVPSYLACYNAKRARPDMDLNFGSGDPFHPGSRCVYLQACMVYGVLFNRSPEGSALRVVKTRDVKELTLTDDEALFLQRTAWDSLQEWRRMVAERQAALARGQVPALVQKPRVLVIGAPYIDDYRQALRQRVLDQRNAEVIFAPSGPGLASEALEGVDDWLGDQKWALVTFSRGTTELAEQTPPREFEKSLRALVSRLKRNGAPLLWTGILPVAFQSQVLKSAEAAALPAPDPSTPYTMNRDYTQTRSRSIAPGAKPLTVVAGKVMEERGLTLDPIYAEKTGGLFAPGGQPAERVITQGDWIQLAEWLADSVGRRVNTP